MHERIYLTSLTLNSVGGIFFNDLKTLIVWVQMDVYTDHKKYSICIHPKRVESQARRWLEFLKD